MSALVPYGYQLGMAKLETLAGDRHMYPELAPVLEHIKNLESERKGLEGEVWTLLDFIARVASMTTGKARADANQILARHGLPTIPLAAGGREAQAAADVVITTIGRLNAAYRAEQAKGVRPHTEDCAFVVAGVAGRTEACDCGAAARARGCKCVGPSHHRGCPHWVLPY